MILKNTLSDIVHSQQEELTQHAPGITREKLTLLPETSSHALVISGIRRCGKSTLLRQLMRRVKGGNYLNFEDPRLVEFEVSDFQKLDGIFREELGDRPHYFFDEIQNVPRWELHIRKLLDQKRHVILTGSNASLLSRELGTRLTGRHLREELYPFSYTEFLDLTGKKPGPKSFNDYLFRGGFPEYLAQQRDEILHELFNDILTRDIAVRHNIQNVKLLKEIALYLLTNTGKRFSYNALKKTFDLGSPNSAKAYVSHLEDSYLLFSIPKFDYSLKKQLVNPRKIYAIDNGISKVNSASHSDDTGRLLENLTYLTLRKQNPDLYYFQGQKHECDFLVRHKGRITHAIQACATLDEDTKHRELNGLTEALDTFNLKEGHILTCDQQDTLKTRGKTITVTPLWQWLTHQNPKKPPTT